MERKLKGLFDFQAFAGNAKLANVIENVERHYANVLSDDELSYVNAAGNPHPQPEDTDDDK